MTVSHLLKWAPGVMCVCGGGDNVCDACKWELVYAVLSQLHRTGVDSR